MMYLLKVTISIKKGRGVGEWAGCRVVETSGGALHRCKLPKIIIEKPRR